jgi:Rrf2 family transcriptional regulator, nitric oxide-sensitive transcriptional repressor
MRLTQHTDYGLRLLMYVALKRGERCTIREAAESFDISRNHLMKIANVLQHHGVLHSTRGKGGGLQLARPANTLHLGDLVQTLEPDMALAECQGEHNHCVLTSQCLLTGVLDNALQAFLHNLNQYTLADICTPKQQQLRDALRISLTNLPAGR